MPSDSIFCQYCRAKVGDISGDVIPEDNGENLPQENTINCPNCGKEIAENSFFCGYCKAIVNGVEDTASQQEAYDEPSSAEPPEYEPTYEEAEYSEIPKSTASKGKYIAIGAAVACVALAAVGSIFFMLSRSDDDKIQTDDSSSKVYNQAEITSVQESEMPDETSLAEVTTTAPTTTAAEKATTTTKKKAEPKKEKQVEVIPATDLLGMTYGQLLDIIGDDYRSTTYSYQQLNNGITSDKYFPDTMVFIDELSCQSYSSEQVKEYFESHRDDVIMRVRVDKEGLFGKGAKAGMSYKDLLVTVDSLSGGSYSTEGACNSVVMNHIEASAMVDGYLGTLCFSIPNNIESLYNKYRIEG